jgi:hypothetical protein
MGSEGKQIRIDGLDKHIPSDEELREKYNSALKELLDDDDYDDDDYDQFNEYVKQAGAAPKREEEMPRMVPI